MRDLLLAADEARQLLRQVVFRTCRLRAGLCKLQCEAVTPPRDRRDRFRSQDLAQRGHLSLQRIVFDHHLRPHTLEQLILGDQVSVAFNQHDQQIESTRADVYRSAGCQQASFIGLQLEAAEPIGGG